MSWDGAHCDDDYAPVSLLNLTDHMTSYEPYTSKKSAFCTVKIGI